MVLEVDGLVARATDTYLYCYGYKEAVDIRLCFRESLAMLNTYIGDAGEQRASGGRKKNS